MKLRKALDKATEIRQESTTSGPSRKPAESEQKDWSSPVYSQSAHRMIDPAVARDNRCICLETPGDQGRHLPDAPGADVYKVLRTQILRQTQEKGWKTLMITSATAGEGKTVTAINLALTMAQKFNQTVLLVDGDLRKQDIHKTLGIYSEYGLGDYLLEEKSLKDLIIWPGIEKMTLISGGKVLGNSTELLESPRMKGLVAEMKNRYQDRYVIFDVPPVLDGADAIAFAPSVDSILMVAEEGKTPVASIQKALSLLPREKFLGFVLNRAA